MHANSDTRRTGITSVLLILLSLSLLSLSLGLLHSSTREWVVGKQRFPSHFRSQESLHWYWIWTSQQAMVNMFRSKEKGSNPWVQIRLWFLSNHGFLAGTCLCTTTDHSSINHSTNYCNILLQSVCYGFPEAIYALPKERGHITQKWRETRTLVSTKCHMLINR